MLPFVPERAGPRFFKFCSAAAAFLLTAGLWLAVRRFGLNTRFVVSGRLLSRHG